MTARGELELAAQRSRAGSADAEDGGILSAADRHEPARVCPTASRGAGTDCGAAAVIAKEKKVEFLLAGYPNTGTGAARFVGAGNV